MSKKDENTRQCTLDPKRPNPLRGVVLRCKDGTEYLLRVGETTQVDVKHIEELKKSEKYLIVGGDKDGSTN